MVWDLSTPFLSTHKSYAPTAGVSSLPDGPSLGVEANKKPPLSQICLLPFCVLPSGRIKLSEGLFSQLMIA